MNKLFPWAAALVLTLVMGALSVPADANSPDHINCIDGKPYANGEALPNSACGKVQRGWI